jgi:hypothetical protein
MAFLEFLTALFSPQSWAWLISRTRRKMDLTTKNDNSEPADICPFGDIVLLVGPKERRLRVSSHCLRVASKVFNVMLGPRWMRADDQKDSPEVRLPEDDSKGMRLFCAVIHYRHDLIPEELPSRLVLKFAILVDKYDTATALSFAIPNLLTRMEPKTSPDLAYVAAASMIFHDDRIFQQVCQRLIFRHNSSYLDLHEDELLRQWLPFRLIREFTWETLFLFQEQMLTSLPLHQISSQRHVTRYAPRSMA